MSIERKLDYFTETIMAEASSARQRAGRERIARQQAALSLALEEAETRIKERVRTRVHELKKERYKTIADATAKERRDYWEKRQGLVRELFASVEERLRAFAASEVYDDYLKEAEEQAKQAGAFPVFEAAKGESLGGYILYDEKHRKRVDCSFASRMAKAMASFALDYEDDNHG
jgi:vacuolar-type H+-ATPase subunit E/Vma4